MNKNDSQVGRPKVSITAVLTVLLVGCSAGYQEWTVTNPGAGPRDHTRSVTESAGTRGLIAGAPGGPGYADGAAGDARFQTPYGLVADRVGNLYVADSGNCVVRKITRDSTVTTLAGTFSRCRSVDGTGSQAGFQAPAGIAIDSAGNLYVAEPASDTIRKITPAGVVTTLAGKAGQSGSKDGEGGAARFQGPWGIAVGADGNMYVADRYNQTIRRITPAGVVSTLAGTAGQHGSADGAGAGARFFFPTGIAVDSKGTVYVLDSNNHTVRKINRSGAVSTLAGAAGQRGAADGVGDTARFSNPDGIAVSLSGTVYVADTGNATIRVITPSGAVRTLAGIEGQIGSTDGLRGVSRFLAPSGITVDAADNVYVTGSIDGTIRKITPAGMVSTVAGMAPQTGFTDGVGSDARFGTLFGSPFGSGAPHGVATDAAGNIYLADTGNHTIRKIDPDRLVSTLAGKAGQVGFADGAGSAARFDSPHGIAVDSSGNAYVSDTSNQAIRRITPNGVVSTLAGTGQPGSTDGAGRAAQFFWPTGIAVDASGSVYVADTMNYTIRRITSDGRVGTLAGTAGQKGSTDGVGGGARFNAPLGIAVDAFGNVYVADYYNETIRKITRTGVVSTVAGVVRQAGMADGKGGIARFWFPCGLATDARGNVYVADRMNNLIRRITPDAVVETIAGSAFAQRVDLRSAPGSLNHPLAITVLAGGGLRLVQTGEEDAVVEISLP